MCIRPGVLQLLIREGDMNILAVLITLGIAGAFLALGVWYVGRRRISVEDYIVSRNTAGTGLATATLVAGALGAWILFSPAETGALFGMSALAGYGIGSMLPIVAFILLGPRLRSLMPHGHSITEYALHRFGPVMYYLTLATVILYMLVFLTAELTGIALAVGLIGGTPLFATALIVGVLTVAYTAYGGMRASLFTDRIQFYIIIPLLVVVIVAGVAGFGGGSLSQAQQTNPEFFSLTHFPGIKFGVVLIIAIFAANMFNQGSWQRVYTARDASTLRKGFLIAGLVVLPVIFLTGLFGILAVGAGEVEDPSVAMFKFIVDVMPQWSIIAVLVLAIVLVMSSMDTLLNGITSAFTTELARHGAGDSLLNYSRLITAALIIIPIIVASQGISVLYIFFIADLVCAAVVFPILLGLYVRNFTQMGAVVSSVVGLIAGVLYFPKPDFSPLINLPAALPGTSGDLLYSFGGALVVSTVIAIVFWLVAYLRNTEPYDFDRLSADVELIEG